MKRFAVCRARVRVAVTFRRRAESGSAVQESGWRFAAPVKGLEVRRQFNREQEYQKCLQWMTMCGLQ